MPYSPRSAQAPQEGPDSTHPPVSSHPTTPVDRALVTPVDFDRSAATFSLLSSPVRVHALWLLGQAEHDVTTLAGRIGVSVPTLSHHLGKLRLAGLVTHRQEGRRQVYGVDDPHIVRLIDETVDHHCDLRLRRG